MVRKEVFEWIITKQKSIELRKGKAKKGDGIIFQCGRNIQKKLSRDICAVSMESMKSPQCEYYGFT